MYGCKVSKDVLETLIRNNLVSHSNKPLDVSLIKTLTLQIIDSIEYLINKNKQNS
jgi:hypothetical protein